MCERPRSPGTVPRHCRPPRTRCSGPVASPRRLCDPHHSQLIGHPSYLSTHLGGGMDRPCKKLESTMKIREKTNDEALNDEALDFVAGGFWDDDGCTPLANILKHI